MIKAVVFDLDDTLVPELGNYSRAVEAACRSVVGEGIRDAAAFPATLFREARSLWHTSPVLAHCDALGIGSPTSLLSDFPGSRAEMAYLREWAPTLRRETWARALAAAGAGIELGPALDAAFRANQLAECPPCDDALPALEALTGRYELAVLTNGPTDVQRAKLRASGLERYFHVVAVSSESGCGKPEARAFLLACERLGVGIEDAVMVGDSLERDVAGARRVGMRCIWLNRDGRSRVEAIEPDAEITSLRDLPGILTALDAA